MSEKLYYKDSHIFRFFAVVTDCREREGGYLISLDRTAFFPEGGGQAADTGEIAGVRVSDVREKDGEIWHYTDAPMNAGMSVSCTVDAEQRLRRMQNHSGEHILSGIIHGLYGFDNVGFHMGSSFMTIDFSGELSWERLMDAERRANEAVRANVPVKAYFPEPAELAAMDYRSKLELTHDVRIVEIEGVDRCACCAPHVLRTGEVGVIKILDSMRHRGGTRLSVVCGMDAVYECGLHRDSVAEVSALLSSKREDITAAVQRVLDEQQRLKEKNAELAGKLVGFMADTYAPTEGNICVFNNELEDPALRELVNLLTEKCRVAAVFSGSDDTGYRYIVGSRSVDLRTAGKKLNSALSGRGGGKPEMIQGSVSADRETIKNFVECDFV